MNNALQFWVSVSIDHDTPHIFGHNPGEEYPWFLVNVEKLIGIFECKKDAEDFVRSGYQGRAEEYGGYHPMDADLWWTKYAIREGYTVQEHTAHGIKEVLPSLP